jgi:hypothetical protein
MEMRDWSEGEKNWLAAVIDSEGWVALTQKHYRYKAGQVSKRYGEKAQTSPYVHHLSDKDYVYFNPRVVVTNTDTDFISKFAYLTHASVTFIPANPPRKAQYKAELSHKKALEVVLRLKSYFITEKKKLAAKEIALWAENNL